MKYKVPVSYYASGLLELKDMVERWSGCRLAEEKFRLQFVVSRVLPAHVIFT